MKKLTFSTAEEYYHQAIRYYRNAKAKLKEPRIEHDRYQDLKPVREGCAMAYLSVLLALDGHFLAHGLEPEKLPTSVDGYREYLRKYLTYNGKITDAFWLVYENLHVFGYYRGASSVQTIKVGFEKAKLIIETLSKKKI